MVEAAGIYARISSDRDGEALGVKRQLADCHAEAERRGWPVANEYVDNDISAYSGKTRPAYQRMLTDLREGVIDALIVYHLDRLHRRPKEFEDFVEVCDRAGMKHLATVTGTVNLGTGDGLFVARMMAAIADHESVTKSRRIRRKNDERAARGLPNGGTRAYGYEADKITVNRDEARVIRTLTERLLAGESLNSLVRWLNDNDIPTTQGKPWRTTTVRGLLLKPRIAGLREHRGQIVGEAVWPAIITTAESERIRAILTDPARRTNRTARRYLLTGMLRCGKCGYTLQAQPRAGMRRYACKNSPGFDGCGGIYIAADPVEELIAQAVLLRLDTPELAAGLAGQHASDPDAVALADQLTDAQNRQEQLAAMFGNGQISADEWTAARKPLEAQIRTAKAQLSRLTQHGTLTDLVGQGEQLRSQWADLNLDRRRAIVKAVFDHAVIHPGRRGGGFDPSRVQAVWRL